MLIKQQKTKPSPSAKLRVSPLTGRLTSNFGFSLIELLVVISIIAVLSALLMANFMGARERARDAQKIDGLNSLKTALRMYYNDNQSYPADKNIILGTGFTAYIANVGDTSFEYSQPNGSDSFVLIIGLEAGAGNDDIDSQIKCGIGASDKIFAVCAN